MAKTLYSIVFLLLNATYIKAYDDIDLEFENGVMGKILRAMVNQTKADTLNLPANSSSIRENITDTFSCDNRTYGYYADVDNDCQLFHVCLPTQAASGRSVTYKWSFICPNETVFNQEVLVCTRPLDAIDCEDSPMYYDINMEIGKETNGTKTEDKNVENIPTNQVYVPTNQENIPMNQENIHMNQENIPTNQKRNKERPQRRRPVKKQNLIIETLLKEVVRDKEELRSAMEIEPKIEDVNEGIPITVDEEDFENSRLFGERSLKMRNEKSRGMFRFKADV